MKTYIVEFSTNYGKAVMIINAANEEEALKVADENHAWPGREIEELDTSKAGLVAQVWS